MVFILFYSGLDKNEYTHVTATYFLLAERKLRTHRLQQADLARQAASSALNKR